MKLENKTLIGLALILATVIALFFVAQDQARTNKLEQERLKLQEQRQYEKEQEAEKQAKIALCMLQAEVNYAKNWEKECESRGLDSNCSLPIKNSDILQDVRKQEKDYCFKLYN